MISVAFAYGVAAPATWQPRLAALRAAGVDGIDLAISWRAHAIAGGRCDFTGPLDVATLIDHARAVGLHVHASVGPRHDLHTVGLGVPDTVFAEPETWARGAHGGPVWLPLPPRALPLLSVDSPALIGHARTWLAQVADVLASRLGDGVTITTEDPLAGAAQLHDAAFAHEYHPAVVTAWQAATGETGAAPTAWSTADKARALGWLTFVEAGAQRWRHTVDDLLTIELSHRNVAWMPPVLAPVQIELLPTPWLPTTPPSAPTRVPPAVVQAALLDQPTWLRLRAPADVDIATLPWLPSVIAAMQAPRAAARVAVIDARADRRVGEASTDLPGLPTAAAAWLGIGAVPLSDDAGARTAATWQHAVAAALRHAGVRFELVPETTDDTTLASYAVVVVPTEHRVERTLWQRLVALAAARRTVVVVGAQLPTHDELDQPLLGELATPRRIGRMRAECRDDIAALAADLTALL